MSQPMDEREQFTDAHGRSWKPTDDGDWREVVSIEEQLLRDIIHTINDFDNEDEIALHLVNDGDNYFDFIGIEVRAAGRDKLKALIDKAISDIRERNDEPSNDGE